MSAAKESLVIASSMSVNLNDKVETKTELTKTQAKLQLKHMKGNKIIHTLNHRKIYYLYLLLMY